MFLTSTTSIIYPDLKNTVFMTLEEMFLFDSKFLTRIKKAAFGPLFFLTLYKIWGATAEIIPIEPDKVIFVRKCDSL